MVQSSQTAGLPCANSSASFWHSEPNGYLLGHRTTKDLPDKADVVIVGSGITGASIARYLAADPRAKSLSVVLLEAREVCWGATGRNGGHCQPLLFDRTPEVAAFEVKNVHAVKSYIEEHNVPCEWRSVTACRTFWRPELFKAGKEEVQKLGRNHPELASKVTIVEGGDVEAMRKHRVNPTCLGLTLTEGAGQLWPYKYVTFIIEKLVREKRINLQTYTPVTKITRISSKTHSHALHTPRGTIQARQAILATNGYTSHILPTFADLIVPVRCEMSALHPPAGSERLPNSYGTVGFEIGHPQHDDYLIQRPFYDSPNGDGTRRGGHLMFGGGRSYAMYNCVGETDDDIVDPGEADYLRRALLVQLELGGETKGLKELKASHQWTGIKGYSRDDMPWVGKVPNQTQNSTTSSSSSTAGSEFFEKGLWLCGGYTGHGMPNATLCGKAVVEMVLAEEQSDSASVGSSYEDTCKRLVEEGELPGIYVITPERVKAASVLPSVVEQDGGGMREWKRAAGEAESKGSRCSVM